MNDNQTKQHKPLKLRLNRESVQELDAEELGKISGGFATFSCCFGCITDGTTDPTICDCTTGLGCTG